MLDVSEVVNDPDLAQGFQIKRPTGFFVREGEWQQDDNPAPLDRFGVITPAKADDVLRFVPEGERAVEMISIYCQDSILMADGKTQLSDLVLWNNSIYKVVFAKPWQDYGYYYAIGAKQ